MATSESGIRNTSAVTQEIQVRGRTAQEIYESSPELLHLLVILGKSLGIFHLISDPGSAVNL